MSKTDVICDRSKEKLTKTPKELLQMTNLKMIFLEGNFLSHLPEDFFWKLPKLMWLDLRNNLLEEIPKSIARHGNLENLLLTNNNLRKLPNEMGLLPKLKTLQVSENPLVYPVRKIIVEGTKAIKNYLKDQYDKQNPPSVTESNTNLKSEDDIILSEEDSKFENEKLVNVIEDFSSGNELDRSHSKASKTSRKSTKSKWTKQSFSEKLKKKISDPQFLGVTLNVHKLENYKNKDTKVGQPLKIIHKISKTGSRISLMSYFNRLGIRTSRAKIEENNLRMGWLNQLRILLNDQEKILQQERNLRAMSDWRWKNRNSTPKVFKDRTKLATSDPPYAVDPEYSKIPSREELAEQLNNFLKQKGITVSQRSTASEDGLNIDKLLNDLMQQLKEMEGIYGSSHENRSPRSEIDHAGKQIKTIMDIQKKLLKLKSSSYM